MAEDIALRFVVPGRIKPKGRVKFSRRGKFVVAYTPAETVATEAMIGRYAALAMRGRVLFQGPISLSVRISLNTPASWSKKKKAETVWVTGRNDADNQLKVISDAMNGVIWKDDSQICEIYFVRRYDDSTGECAEITVLVAGGIAAVVRSVEAAGKALGE